MRILLMVNILVVVALMFGNGCGKPLDMKGASTAQNSIDPGTIAQAPQASCVLSSAGQTIMNISSYTSAYAFAMPPVAPATVSLDCSSSTVSTGNGISMAVSFDGGKTFISSNSLTNFLKSGLAVGIYPIVIKLTDTVTGLSSLTPFQLPVSCNPNTTPAINFNAAGTTFSSAAIPGYVNVNLPGASGGGSGPYLYSIDLDGDGRFDAYQAPSTSAPGLWNQSTTFSNMYNLYSTYPGQTRAVNIRVFDTACNMMANFATSVDWTTVMPAPVTSASIQPYYYVQANINPLTSGDTDAGDNVQPFDAMSNASDPAQHVLCNYDISGGQGAFQIKGLNYYDDGVPTDKGALFHGMDFTIPNIPDNGGTSAQTSSGLNFTQINYQTAQSSDGGLQKYMFSQSPSSGCSVTVTVSRATGVTPCNNGTTHVKIPVTDVRGSFSCNNLSATSPTLRQVSVNNGFFYCQTALVDQCSGGGGNTGNIPPPQF